MLTLVSVSLNSNMLMETDKLQKNLGFSGRDEIVQPASGTFWQRRRAV
jgi:metal-responsive CopG/Arc/MetJ family transcriptional regulator